MSITVLFSGIVHADEKFLKKCIFKRASIMLTTAKSRSEVSSIIRMGKNWRHIKI